MFFKMFRYTLSRLAKITLDVVSADASHPSRSLVEPGTLLLVSLQVRRPQGRLALQHHGRPVREAGPGGPEARRGSAAAGPARPLQPDGRDGVLPSRRPPGQPQQARGGLGTLGGGGGGGGGEISGGL